MNSALPTAANRNIASIKADLSLFAIGSRLFLTAPTSFFSSMTQREEPLLLEEIQWTPYLTTRGTI